ncbi:MAG: VOC family protein [Acidobacteriia bacterium]|nr:VOC family protein [Terriglobia bacterium]MBV8902789.1 VOC family protein [Terriglobia bacterium]
MIARMRLHGAMLYVKDLNAMKQFYGDMLGLKPTNQDWTDVWATFDTGNTRLALHAIPAEIAKSIEIASPPAQREKSPVKLIFEVKYVESERARLESLGIQMVRRPWQKIGEACDGIDPEGNIFQICSAGAEPLL